MLSLDESEGHEWGGGRAPEMVAGQDSMSEKSNMTDSRLSSS